MARKPLRECRVYGCHNLTRDGYCNKHIGLKTERHKVYDKCQRDKEAAGFYKSSAWMKARALSMVRHYGLCQDCLNKGMIKQADMVHHIKPLREFPDLALEQSNLRPLCNQCHAKYK